MSQDRWTVLHHDPKRTSLKGITPESWLCVDCGVNTSPGSPNRKEAELEFVLHGESHFTLSDEAEVYTVKDEVWALTGLGGWGGCLCIGCLEKRIGRRLKPKDFAPDHPFNTPDFPATRRLRKRKKGIMIAELRGEAVR